MLLMPAPARAGLLVGSVVTGTVHRFDETTGAFIDTAADTSPTSRGFTIGPDGNLYLSHGGTPSIFQINGATGEFMRTFASGGGLSDPRGILFAPNGNLLVTGLSAPNGAGHILQYNGTTGAPMGVFASGGGLNLPVSLTYGPDGNLYVTSAATHNVLRYNGTTGAFMDIFADAGSAETAGCTFGPDGNLYVSSFTGNLVMRFNGSTGASMGAFITAGSGGLSGAGYMHFAPGGMIYVASYHTNSVLRYNASNGAFIDTFISGSPLNGPFAMSSDVPEPRAISVLALALFALRRRKTTDALFGGLARSCLPA